MLSSLAIAAIAEEILMWTSAQPVLTGVALTKSISQP